MQNVSELAISPEVLRTPFQKESSMTERYRSVIDCIHEKSTLVLPSVPFSILQYITSKLGQTGTNWDKFCIFSANIFTFGLFLSVFP